jgi:hypothetical protein
MQIRIQPFRQNVDPNPHLHYNADPDPVLHYKADPDPVLHDKADPDPAIHYNADPDPPLTILRARIQLKNKANIFLQLYSFQISF